MNSRKTALSFAAVGTAAGVIGLVVLAAPANAGEAPPALPSVSAQELVKSVLDIKAVPALAGSVEIDNNLGLPIPGVPTSSGDGDAVQIWADGTGKGRLAIADRQAETTIVDDGTTVWVWSSDARSVTKVPHAEGEGVAEKPFEGKLADPAAAATELVTAMQQDSTVTVDGTARVAGRPVYQLVLTPKPSERTLLREIRVSVDSELRIPLQLEVLANGQADPAVKIGFTKFSTGTQDPKLFTFTPPAGATVSEEHIPDEVDGKNIDDWLSQVDLKTVGRGWDIVLTGRIPADAMKQAEDMTEGADQDMFKLLGTIGKEVHGTFGTGYVISASVGSVLITEDGKVALGAVPAKVVEEAAATMK